MTLTIDPGTGVPTAIQEWDGFDTDVMDTNRWETPIIEGSTSIVQSGELIFINDGIGTKGISYYETKRKLGKHWRITADLKLVTATGSSAKIALCLYKNANCYVKIGPVKNTTLNCNCCLYYKRTGEAEQEIPLTGDLIDTTSFNNYTMGIINDTIIIYYKGIMVTSFPFEEMINFTVRIEAGTGADTDAIVAYANDYEAINKMDVLLMKLGEYAIATYTSAIATYNKIGTSIITDVSGTITLTNITEQFITLTQAIYGTKFRVNLFADLEGQLINYCYLYKSATAAYTDQSIVANSMKSNTILLLPAAGAAVGDCIYFGNVIDFRRLDVYMEQGTSNTDNTFVWEYWNGAAWATLTVTDGTNNGKVFGKSGKVTFTTAISSTSVNGTTAYWIRARLTVLGTSRPIGSHIQVSTIGATGFDANAEFLSNLIISIYRKRGDGAYAAMPADMALPYTQCWLYKNIEIGNLPAWTDIKIGFKLSETPVASIAIPYTGFVETIEV